MKFRPVDDAARDRVRTDHDTSFVVEAGAGTGKTTLLIDRIEALIRSGRATLDQIAAVTFTENAATTMKLRLRERLEKVRAEKRLSAAERERSAAALDILERAPISTIHALCAAMLQERPLECGVVPGFRTADETESDLIFSEAWDEWLADRLTAGDDVLLAALDADIPVEAEGFGERTSLRGLARRLVYERDLAPLLGAGSNDPESLRDELGALGERAGALASSAHVGDTLGARLRALAGFTVVIADLTGPPLETQLLDFAPIAGKGDKSRWPSPQTLEEARSLAGQANEAVATWRVKRSEAFHARVVGAVLGVVALYEKKKSERGVLDFLDLLIKARDALQKRESVREYFRARFPYLIIDEFQDTDPVQVQIAELLTARRRGSLVVVGDAKQSIYRFRRADVDLFRRLSRRAADTQGHAVLHLTQSFRSRSPILRFVNRVFGELIQASDEAGQPPYEPIDPPPRLATEPSIVALRFEAPLAYGIDLLRSEAAAAALFVAEAARGGYEVRDPDDDRARPSRAGDVLVLVRRLTQIRPLEEAFEAAGLRFTVEGGKSFFDRWEVHEALAVLRAIDDPSDRVALVAALRSSFFGVSDRDIAAYVLDGGFLSLGAVDTSKQGGDALGPAIDVLRDLSRRRRALSVPRVLEALYDRTRVLAALTGTRRGEAQIANLEKVVALARQASDLGVLTLRGFVSLLSERITAAGEEPDLPTTRPGDPHTVRILTIHKAKGLEAPIVVLHDTADENRPSSDSIPLWDEGKVAIGFRAGCQPPGWDVLKRRDDARAWAESRRLLYVACTRARDLLVVPAPPPSAHVGGFLKDLVARLPRTSDDEVAVIDASTLPEPSATREADVDAPALVQRDAVAARWDAERGARLASGSYRPFTPRAVTAVAAVTAPPSVLQASSGSGGRSFGALVHRILEHIPFESPERSVVVAESLAPLFGLDAAAGRRAAESVVRTLGLPLMERARRAKQVWRELPLWFPDDDVLVEGIIDLVFEEQGGLVVVDYKTDAIDDAMALAQAAHHAPQLQLYGRGLAQGTGMSVKERLVLFTGIGRAVAV